MANKGTARQKVAKAVAKLISDNIPELDGNSLPVLKFWDEVQDFPFVSVTCANEQREYLPGGFEWGYCAVMIRLYVKSDDSPLDDTEVILEKIVNAIFPFAHICAFAVFYFSRGLKSPCR